MRRILSFCVCTFLYLTLTAQTGPEALAKANQGDTEAMMQVSEWYRFGFNGLEKKEDSADHWIKKAADTGNSGAKYLLGLQYSSKIYQASTYSKGIKYLKQAADSGNVDAMVRLSEIYREGGTGTESDKYYSYNKAFSYSQKAAETGNAEALLYCGKRLLKTKGKDSLAVAYIRRAAEVKGMPEAQIKMGDLYMDGVPDGKLDLLAAFQYYNSAYTNRRANIDQKTEAEIGIFRVDQEVKRIHNLMMQGNFLLSGGELTYKLRKL